MTTVAKYETTSAPFAVFLETRVGGVATENANAFGLESSIASTLRWGSWQAYDGTVVDRLDARYYNNNFGRFWSVDPSGHANPDNPQSWNQYAYTGGDPVNFRDPTGRFSYNPDDPCGPFGVWMGEGCYNDGGGSGDGFSSDPDPPVLSYPGLGTGAPGSPILSPGGISFPKCNPSHSNTVAAQLVFVSSNYAAALAESATIQSQMPTLSNGTQEQANQSNLTDAFLDWSAFESAWGMSAYALQGNYFGYGSAASFSSSTTWGAELSQILNVVPVTANNPNPGGAAYGSFLVAALINNPNASPAAILQAIANAGYNSEAPPYGNRVASAVNSTVQSLINCLQQNYANYL